MPTKLVVDCSTGQTTEVELTAEEIADNEARAAAWAEEQAKLSEEAQIKAAAKQSAQDKLKALGLTDIEVAALVNA